MGHRRHSSISRMPPELRREIEKLLAEGRTYDEIVGAVRGLGGQVSRSAVGRHAVEWRELTDRLRLAREMSQAIGRELEEVDGDAGRLVIESLQGLLLQAQLELGKEAVDPKTIASMSKAVRDLQAALKTNVETELKVRERAAKDAAKAADLASAELGLSEETATVLRARILGIARKT